MHCGIVTKLFQKLQSKMVILNIRSLFLLGRDGGGVQNTITKIHNDLIHLGLARSSVRASYLLFGLHKVGVGAGQTDSSLEILLLMLKC